MSQTPQSRNPVLTGKLLVAGRIKVLTGLHIGGSKADLDIGGVDLNVIKTARGLPFIPGSSLKGKLRSLLARAAGSISLKDDPQVVKELFGYTADTQNQAEMPARLIFRDAELLEDEFDRQFDRGQLDTRYTEVKWENTINRITGTAAHPRQLERVPPGALFRFEIIYNEYDDGKREAHLEELACAMRMLKDDYLGGQGTRGYGRVDFCNVECRYKPLSDYARSYPAGTVVSFPSLEQDPPA